jgi:uncharacterized protein YyaL (SSP411 family)
MQTHPESAFDITRPSDERNPSMANRLAKATSPYLLQHAENPVDWWEWSPAAFDEARRLDRPVLLSVGYAACHWCHEVDRSTAVSGF